MTELFGYVAWHWLTSQVNTMALGQPLTYCRSFIQIIILAV